MTKRTKKANCVYSNKNPVTGNICSTVGSIYRYLSSTSFKIVEHRSVCVCVCSFSDLVVPICCFYFSSSSFLRRLRFSFDSTFCVCDFQTIFIMSQTSRRPSKGSTPSRKAYTSRGREGNLIQRTEFLKEMFRTEDRRTEHYIKKTGQAPRSRNPIVHSARGTSKQSTKRSNTPRQLEKPYAILPMDTYRRTKGEALMTKADDDAAIETERSASRTGRSSARSRSSRSTDRSYTSTSRSSRVGDTARSDSTEYLEDLQQKKREIEAQLRAVESQLKGSTGIASRTSKAERPFAVFPVTYRKVHEWAKTEASK